MEPFRGLLILLSIVNLTWGHIPTKYADSAEPEAAIYISDTPVLRESSPNAQARVQALRDILTENNIDAYIVPTADAHSNTYISPADARREWLSGLQGSSGTALVTNEVALVWTDARYFTQFDRDVDKDVWTLMRQGIDVTLNQWLVSNLPANSRVGIDPTTYTRSEWTSLEATLTQANINLVATFENLVDTARRNINDGPPDRPANELLPLHVNFTGRPSSEKIAELRTQIQSRSASALLITALDEIAYSLNLRGTDIPYNPVFFAYLIIKSDVNAVENIILFWKDGVLSNEVLQHLSSENVQVSARPYDSIFNYLRNIPTEAGNTIWMPEGGSHAIYLAVENEGLNSNLNIISTVSPVALIKVVKNQVELQGFRNAHVKDGVALARAFYWLHQEIDAGRVVSEIQLSDKLQEFRCEEQYAAGPSFATIAGAGENGAIIHYSPSREGEQRYITKDDMVLVDSGGQYYDGTTDITRTRHMSEPTPAQIMTFTRVLKGQINLATAVFPSGTLGHVIEVLARKYLWDVGLNYGHGTGHGVGHFLNVHEGPAWILSGPAANDPGIRENMIYSNEPGYYEVDSYGIRHEDLVQTIIVNSTADHIRADEIVSDFDGRGAVGFYTISLAPFQQKCLDVDLLTDFELKYLNDYHARVLSTLGPILQQRNFTDVYEWLEQECAPIVRQTDTSQENGAISVRITQFVVVLSVFVVFFK